MKNSGNLFLQLDIVICDGHRPMLHYFRTKCKVQDANRRLLGKLVVEHEFAFVLRSSGLFTYAIVAHRQKDMILFVVGTLGSIKLMSKRRWLSSIRLVNQQDNSASVLSPIKKGANSTASNSCGNQLRPPPFPRSGDQRKKSPDAATQNLFGLGSRSQPDAFPRSL